MEPKYRAWYKKNMWKVETIYFNDGHPESTRIRISRTNDDGKYEWELPFRSDLSLMPFVGLDEDANRIYEGDIIAYKYMGTTVKEIVRYVPSRAGFEPFIGVARPPDWVHVHMDRVKVVGNILENPAIIEEEIHRHLSNQK